MNTAVKPRETRTPTGKASWPLALLAGVHGSGKTYKAAEASASPLLNTTYWVSCGEPDPDEYALIPDANFQIVTTDGTYRDTLEAILWASAQPGHTDGRPNLVVLDSGTRLWALLSDMAQDTATRRWMDKEARRNGGKAPAVPTEDVPVGSDLWNIAGDRWRHIMEALRANNGPSIITARADLTTIFDASGKPTKDKEWSVKIQKLTPFEVDMYVQMRASYPESDNVVSRVRSLRYDHPTKAGKPVAKALPDAWTMDGLWRNLGLDNPADVAPANHTPTVVVSDMPTTNATDQAQNNTPPTSARQTQAPEAADGERDPRVVQRTNLLSGILASATMARIPLDTVKQKWAATHNGEDITQTRDLTGLTEFAEGLAAHARTVTAQPAQPAQAQDAPAAAEDARSTEDALATKPRTETAAAKNARRLADELAYQADVLQVPYSTYTEQVTVNGAHPAGEGRAFAVAQRPQVIEALRAQGRATEADEYASQGKKFPVGIFSSDDDAPAALEPAQQ